MAHASTIRPCIWFDGNAEEAANAYVALFPEGAILHVGRYAEHMPQPAGSVMIVEFTIGGQIFQALNGGPQFKPNPAISFFVQVREEAEARRFYEGLAAGGKALMPLGAYPWSPCFAWVEDRFGVTWQIITGDFEAGAPLIVPCLMCTGTNQGRARAPRSRVFARGDGRRLHGMSTGARARGLERRWRDRLNARARTPGLHEGFAGAREALPPS